ncbi:MAG TPA: hypothetical protein VIH65_01865 [Xanthobacteraceae bacterium]
MANASANRRSTNGPSRIFLAVVRGQNDDGTLASGGFIPIASPGGETRDRTFAQSGDGPVKKF